MKRRKDDDISELRIILLTLATVTLVTALFLMALFWSEAAYGQALVDMTRYDYTEGRQEVACRLDSLDYVCPQSGCVAVIVCHSHPDGLFKNGFEP